ncbi:MAG TPA: hypothetical protein ENH29_06310 [Bacteroidetes bacterium]|nr:hypothetical protein [Bacteroidota bacterium]
MKKMFMSFVLAALCFSMVMGQETTKNYWVKAKIENLRSSPKGNILGKLNAGTKLKVIKEEGNWVKVRVEGYIWKPSVTTDATNIAGFKFHAMHILLRNKTDAKKVLQELLNGADFNELAVKYSIDPGAKKNRGDLGLFEKGDLVKEFEDAVLKLKPGQISGVVKTPLGYHIIKRVR